MKVYLKIKGKWSHLWDRDTSKAEFNPYRDWKFILSGALAGLLFAIVSNVFLYFYVQSEDTVTADVQTDGLSLNQSGLNAVLKSYGAKTDRFNALLSNRTGEFERVADPSI